MQGTFVVLYEVECIPVRDQKAEALTKMKQNPSAKEND